LPAGRRAFLVYANYETLLGYNCAHAYALAVGQLADRIRR
jgi:membrane-bound lytic murein transglycosylase B